MWETLGKLYEHNCYKTGWEEMDKFIKVAYKTKKGGNFEDQPRSFWARYVPLAQKRKIRGHLCPKNKE